jgi:putative zinc finger/helix-turn-helix YgiT family protein
MVEEHIHELEERRATVAAPYRFVGSGLSNVYLIGVKFRVCRSCNAKIAEIPAVKQLMISIARAVVEGDSPLSGEEIRFLRKRLGKRSSDFARLVGVSLEEVSRWENDHNAPGRSADKLIRILYSVLSGDSHLRERVNKDIEELVTVMAGESREAPRIRLRLLRNHAWQTEAVSA